MKPDMRPEAQVALELANRVLDRTNLDPDEDIAVLARQFIRVTETRDKLRTALERIRYIEGINPIAHKIALDILRATERTHTATTQDAQ